MEEIKHAIKYQHNTLKYRQDPPSVFITKCTLHRGVVDGQLDDDVAEHRYKNRDLLLGPVVLLYCDKDAADGGEDPSKRSVLVSPFTQA